MSGREWEEETPRWQKKGRARRKKTKQKSQDQIRPVSELKNETITEGEEGGELERRGQRDKDTNTRVRLVKKPETRKFLGFCVGGVECFFSQHALFPWLKNKWALKIYLFDKNTIFLEMNVMQQSQNKREWTNRSDRHKHLHMNSSFLLWWSFYFVWIKAVVHEIFSCKNLTSIKSGYMWSACCI